MASLLAAGAGASEGLDTLLTRLMAEQEMARRNAALAEETRHNKADEGLRGDQLKLSSQDRQDAIKERDKAQVRANATARGIGDTVPESEFSTETSAGMPSGDYKITPGAKVTKLAGFTSLPGSVSSMTGQGAAPDPTKSDFNVSQEEDSPLNAPRLINFRGTEAQRLARDREMLGQPVNVEQKTMLYKGKPTDVLLNPRTQRYTLNGQDVTADVSHYEKPPSPDRVLIQTGTGYETREQARKDLLAGKDVGLPTTTTTRTMMEGAQMLEPHIAKVQSMATELDKAGLFGPVMSRVRDALTKAGTIDEFAALISADPEMQKDRLAGRFATSLGLLASGAGRVHGGARGGGSPMMYQQFKDLLSSAATLPMFMGRLDGLNEYMSGYAAGPGGGKTPDAQPAAGDLYQQYLQRTKP